MIPASFDIFSSLSVFIYGPQRLNHIGLWGFLLCMNRLNVAYYNHHYMPFIVMVKAKLDAVDCDKESCYNFSSQTIFDIKGKLLII